MNPSDLPTFRMMVDRQIATQAKFDLDKTVLRVATQIGFDLYADDLSNVDSKARALLPSAL